MNKKDLLDLVKKQESTLVEFKETAFLKDSRKIAKQIVAFCNHHGGRILIGIRNDGSIEGKMIDYDKEALRISDIAKNICSPIVTISTEFGSYDEGDVLVINVPPRRGIPCAVVKRRHHEIRHRTYYIRTAAGIRPVGDNELEWMFKNQGIPKLESRFTIGIIYNREHLGIPPVDAPQGIWEIASFVNSLEKDDIQYLCEEEFSRVPRFFLEIMPYAILKTMAFTFSHSWLIEIVKSGGMKTIHPKIPSIEKQIMKISDISQPSGLLISGLSFDFPKTLNSGWNTISVPTGTNIEIKSGNNEKKNKSIRLVISRQNLFNIEITIQESMSRIGVPGTHPLSTKYQRIDIPTKTVKEFQKKIATVLLDVSYAATFGFPNIDDFMFPEYFEFGSSVLDLIRENWDWDSFTKNLPDKILYSMESKIDEILKRLK